MDSVPATHPIRAQSSWLLVEWAELRGLGLTDVEVSALLSAGLMAPHTPASSEAAQSPGPCLILTTTGIAQLFPFLARIAVEVRGPCSLVPPASTPKWDSVRGELWWQGEVVKHYRHSAASQREVLDAFQRQGWPARIDNPFQGGGNRKRRLREAIKSLNRVQHPLRLRFRGDGRGGVCWEEVKER